MMGGVLISEELAWGNNTNPFYLPFSTPAPLSFFVLKAFLTLFPFALQAAVVSALPLRPTISDRSPP
jgi:hypothetical protein